MESVIEKLGFFDFFNLIIVGMFTIVGCFSITYQFGCGISRGVALYLVNTVQVNTILVALCIVSIIAISYIVGMLCQEVYSLIDNELFFITLITHLFQMDSCINNQIKRERYAALAKIIFERNDIDYSNALSTEWCWELNNYFFTYCLYQLQIRGLNKKTEKLRDIEGLAKSFCASTIILLAVLLGSGFASWNTFTLPRFVFVMESLLLLVISIIFHEYRKRALKNRIRMTLSLYESVYDSEKAN